MVVNVLVGMKSIDDRWTSYVKTIQKENIYSLDIKTNEKRLSQIVKNKNIGCIVLIYRDDYNYIKRHPELVKLCAFLDEKTWSLLRDKSKFNEYLMKNYPLNVPTVYCSNKKMINNNIVYPVVVKPSIAFGGNGIVLCHNKEQLNQHKNPDIIQEFTMNEYEYVAHLFCKDGAIINSIIIRQKDDIYNIRTSLFDPEKLEYIDDFDMTFFIDIVKKLNYSGGFCANFKLQDGVIKIFEINPRFGGSVYSLDLFKDLITFNN